MHENQPLNKHTSWRVGGPAKRFYQPDSLVALQTFLETISSDEPILWLGLGSNLLIRDKGFNGTVVSTLSALESIELKDSTIIRAEAGVSCAKLARFSARLGLAGGEFWAGIPGSVGGALAMNAGCHGGETWAFVTHIETLSTDGKLHLRKASEYKVSYREVIPPAINECFVAAHFQLPLGKKEASLQKIKDLLEHRARTQPTGDHSCGSVFRNPKGDYAARLIEASGLKGVRQGGAMVSHKHANFIVNDNQASASDIETLIEHVSVTVESKFGISLVKEVKIIGDK